MKKILKTWTGLVLLDIVQADLPVHCPIEKVVGAWNIKSVGVVESTNQLFQQHSDTSASTFDFTIDLNNIYRPTQAGPTREALDLPFKIDSIPDGASSGTWSMIYDAGFVVQLEFSEYSLIFYGSFVYYPDPDFHGNPTPWVLPSGGTPGYISDCSTITKGWVLKRTGTLTRTQHFTASLLEGAALGLSPVTVGRIRSLNSAFPLAYAPEEYLPVGVPKYTKQGDCGSCFVLSFAHAFEATWYKQTKARISIDREAILACSYSSQGCNGGYYQSLILDLLVTGIPLSGCMDMDENQFSAKTKIAQTCDLSCFENSLVYPSGFVELQTQARIQHWLLNVGPVPVALNLPAHLPGGIVPVNNEVKGTWSYVSHAVVLVGWGETSKGERYWEVYNPWGGDSARIRISRSESDGILEHYAIGIKASIH